MLELTGVHVGYGRTSVVHGVDVSVADGGVTAVLGHNGAGKTTLLRAAVGLLPVRSGRVTLDGEDVTRLRPHQRVRRGLAYVPQGQQSFGQLTARENLQLVADGAGSAGASRVDDALDLFPALRGL
ncbi:ATP-binding cassette domain-containing protein, partial [Cellulomonas septica]